MSVVGDFVPVSWNNENFELPEDWANEWGDDVTNFLVSVAANALSKAGGQFVLTAEVDFGPSFGLKSIYYKTATANPATTGSFRLASSDGVVWRNQANDGNLVLSINANDRLQYAGRELVDLSSVQTLTNKNFLFTPVTITDSIYTLEAEDANSKLLQFDSVSGQVVNIPDDTVVIPVGTEIPLSRIGTGPVQIVSLGLAILQNPYNTSLLRNQFSSASLMKVAANVWRIVGDIDNSI
jgi:hypothetical protein